MLFVRITACVEVTYQHETDVSEAFHLTIDRLAIGGVPISDSSVECKFVTSQEPNERNSPKP